MFIQLVSSAFCALGFPALLACGDAMTTEPGPIAEIRGVVSNDAHVSVANPSAFHVTAFWLNPANKASDAYAADVPIDASYPSEFSLGLVAAPPPSAENEGTYMNAAFHFFIAEIGAYEDVVGSGHYLQSVDPLLGVAPRIRLLYLARPDEIAAANSFFPGAVLGFNLFVAEDDNACDHPIAGVGCHDQRVIPMSSVISLDLTPNAHWE